MASGGGMAAWSFLSALALATMLAPAGAAAELAAQHRRDIARLAESRGVAAGEVAPLVEEIDRAASRGLPAGPLANKVKEGLAKGVPPARVQTVLRGLVGNMDSAVGLLGTVPDAALRARAIEVLAEALGRGVTAEDVKRLAQGAGAAPAESLAFGAKGWALLREAGIPSDDGVALMSEAMRHGFRSADLLALAREVSRRRDEFASGRASLDAVREAVRRGERPERVMPPERVEWRERAPVPPVPERPERPPEPPAERPDRPERPPR